MKRNGTIKRRRQLARSLERAAVPERPFLGRGPRYLVQPSVTAACAPSLRALAAALRDETRPVDEESLARVRTFILRGDSPFFGRDATEALREAVRLQHIVVGAEAAVPDQEFKNLGRTAAAVVATIALAVAFAVLTVPSALAAGRCPCNEDLPLSANISQAAKTSSAQQMARHFQHEDALYQLSERQGIARPSALAAGGCPCNEDLPLSANISKAAKTTSLPGQGLTRVSRLAVLTSSLNRPAKQYTTAAKPASAVSGNGFDCGDAGIGVAAAFGAMLLAAGSAIGFHKRGRLVPHS